MKPWPLDILLRENRNAIPARSAQHGLESMKYATTATTTITTTVATFDLTERSMSSFS